MTTDVLVTPRAPTDNIVRARHDIGTIELRAKDDGTGRTLNGHFAVFNKWTEINSAYEGRFLERIAPGAFARTFKERGDKIRVLYDHGLDPSIGNKPLAVPTRMEEDRNGAYYEAELFEASYVEDLLPALRAGQLGASFRFRVTAEEWVDPKTSTKTNPAKLAERTITDVDLYEFGPVTFPAYADATAGVRSGTDEFFERLAADEEWLARYIDRAGPRVAAKFLASLPTVGRSEPDTSPTGDDLEPVDGDEVTPPEDTPVSDETPDATAVGQTTSSETKSEETPAPARATPNATAVGQTEGNRKQIQEALKRFRQTNRKDT